jgi:hypothetical protein
MTWIRVICMVFNINGQYWETGTQDKEQKHSTICVVHHYIVYRVMLSSMFSNNNLVLKALFVPGFARDKLYSKTTSVNISLGQFFITRSYRIVLIK